MTIDQYQQQLGVVFTDPDLLYEALTHRSYVNEHPDQELTDNERLEFLGDAVLDFIAGEMLFNQFPAMPEGDLTRLRAALVRTEALAAIAHLCQVGENLRMGKGEEASGGRERLNNLCGAFEALVGALYLDQGLDAVRTFVTPYMQRMLEQVLAESLDKDARSLLQEWSQANRNLTPAYRTVSAVGPDHEKIFTVQVLIGDDVAGQGTGRSKQAAAMAAARAALSVIEKNQA